MKQQLSITTLLILISAFAMAQLPRVSSGKIIRWENLSSSDIVGRNVDIWLPDGYNEKTKYNVLYMNDGQKLFDNSITWNKQEWKVDEWMSFKGYAPGTYVSRVYNGADHNENSWAARLDRPLIFLLGKE